MRTQLVYAVLAASLALTSCSKSSSCTPSDLDAKFTEISTRADAAFGKDSETSKIMKNTVSAQIAEIKAAGNIDPDKCVTLDKMIGTLSAQ